MRRAPSSCALIGAAAIATAAIAAAGCRESSPPARPRGASHAASEQAGTGEADRASAADTATARSPPDDAGRDGAGPAEAPLAAIPADPLFTNLDVPGFPAAVVSVPNGATSARPALVVLHGSGDRPDWNCDAWRHITGAQGFVLCLRGRFVPAESTRDDARFTLRGGAELARHLATAFDALGARFGAYADLDRPLAAGFSLGATEIAQRAIAEPARFPRVALVEGGHEVWTVATARAFAAGGGRRVLFGCGSPWCMPAARAALERLHAGGVEARVVHANVGHTTDRPLQEAIMRELAWFVDGDPRWSAGAGP